MTFDGIARQIGTALANAGVRGEVRVTLPRAEFLRAVHETCALTGTTPHFSQPFVVKVHTVGGAVEFACDESLLAAQTHNALGRGP